MLTRYDDPGHALVTSDAPDRKIANTSFLEEHMKCFPEKTSSVVERLLWSPDLTNGAIDDKAGFGCILVLLLAKMNEPLSDVGPVLLCNILCKLGDQLAPLDEFDDECLQDFHTLCQEDHEEKESLSPSSDSPPSAVSLEGDVGNPREGFVKDWALNAFCLENSLHSPPPQKKKKRKDGVSTTPLLLQGVGEGSFGKRF